MTAIPNIGCGFEDPPMMLALAQISFTHSPRIIQGITSVKASLEDLQLPVAQTKSRTNVSFSTPGAAPQVSQSEFWWFSSLDRRRAVAVAQNSVVLYDANYQSFQEFSKLLAEVVEIIVSEAGEGRNVSITLRQPPSEFSVAFFQVSGSSPLRWGPAPKPPGFFQAWLGCSKGL